MTDIRSRLADALLGHTPRHENNGVDLWLACACGDGVRYYDRRKHVAHVASELLSLPGIAIVDSKKLVALHDLGTEIHSSIEEIWDRDAAAVQAQEEQ